MNQKIAVFWFRRDFRFNDNHGFFQALKSGLPVLPVFIFDTEILNKLTNKNDARISFIYAEIQKLKAEFEKAGSSLLLIHSSPIEAFQQLVNDYQIHAVFTNKDYEPYALQRDKKVGDFLQQKGISFFLFKDHIIFEENEIVKDNGEPYTVFTPYSKKWKQVLGENEIQQFPSEKYLGKLLKTTSFILPHLEDLGFEKSSIVAAPLKISEKVIADYAQTRDMPCVEGTSKLGVHLRFGTVSIREVTRVAKKLSDVFLNELIWRNFFIGILWHFPHVVERSFKTKYDFISWRNNEDEFQLWCNGETGYPMVDAGMRELNATGFMHNRVRMVTASFLTKHLLIDWRWGEAYFAEKLLDFELASNNGNWQWASGCGCDAAPYFRVFNPEAQQKKFDLQKKYVLKWVPEYGTLQYPQPVVEQSFARERVLKAYKNAFK